MSHIVSVNFEQIGIECAEVCNRVESRIAELQKLLDVLARKSQGVIDDQTKLFVHSIEKNICQWLNEVRAIRNASRRDSRKGIVNVDSDSRTFLDRYKQKDLIYNLKREVNKEVAEMKPAVRAIISQIDLARINNLNKQSYSDHQTVKGQQPSHGDDRNVQETKSRIEKLQSPQAHASIITSSDLNIGELLGSIEDVTLRQFTYMAYVLNHKLGKDEIIQEGKRMYETKMEEERKKVFAEDLIRQKQEMEEAKIPQEDIDKALDVQGSATEKLEQLYEQTSNAIVKENKRKESLKIILKSIKSQGFIVSSSDIVRQGDKVVMRAHKVGGQTAKFTIDLDGKFIYDFQGYEGQACQNDIEPFLKDLEEIYGVDLVNRHEIWKNPDKIQNRKMQVKNTIKDKM